MNNQTMSELPLQQKSRSTVNQTQREEAVSGGLKKVESSFSFEVLKREELKTLLSVSTQCDSLQEVDGKEFCFESFDLRKCLRCGLND